MNNLDQHGVHDHYENSLQLYTTASYVDHGLLAAINVKHANMQHTSLTNIIAILVIHYFITMISPNSSFLTDYLKIKETLKKYLSSSCSNKKMAT